MIDLNATQAAIRAGYSVKNAASIRGAATQENSCFVLAREHGTQLERRYHTGPSDAGVGLLTEFLHTTTRTREAVFEGKREFVNTITRAKISPPLSRGQAFDLTPKFTPNSFYLSVYSIFTPKAEKADFTGLFDMALQHFTPTIQFESLPRCQRSRSHKASGPLCMKKAWPPVDRWPCFIY